MPGMVPDAGEALDDVGDPRERPQIGPKAMRRRPSSHSPFYGRQRFGSQPRLAPGSARPLQPRSALAFPRVVPVVRTDPRHAERPGHRRLRFASREQPRGLQPARFQRGQIPSESGHASACDGTREIR